MWSWGRVKAGLFDGTACAATWEGRDLRASHQYLVQRSIIAWPPCLVVMGHTNLYTVCHPCLQFVQSMKIVGVGSIHCHLLYFKGFLFFNEMQSPTTTKLCSFYWDYVFTGQIEWYEHGTNSCYWKRTTKKTPTDVKTERMPAAWEVNSICLLSLTYWQSRTWKWPEGKDPSYK